jgi:hypothetical protein
MNRARSFLGRCAGCRLSFHKVKTGPMLPDEMWQSLGCKPRDILCDACVRRRIEQVYGRPLRFEDLTLCPFNVFSGYLDELAPPELKAKMAKMFPATRTS